MGFNFMVIQMRARNKLVYGVGDGFAGYNVRNNASGKDVWCAFYKTWCNMLKRCYCSKFHEKNQSYSDCSVSIEWLKFVNFKSWMEKQDWQGKELDKDLLVVGNRVYSADTCVFIDKKINKFTADRSRDRGEFPIGVYFDSFTGLFKSQCSNPDTGKQQHIGRFDSAEQAHQAWKSRKHQHACKLAAEQSDPKVAQALRTRYA